MLIKILPDPLQTATEFLQKKAIPISSFSHQAYGHSLPLWASRALLLC